MGQGKNYMVVIALVEKGSPLNGQGKKKWWEREHKTKPKK